MQAMLEADKGLVKLCLGLVSCLWDLLSEKNIAKPERVQRMSARLIFSEHRRTDGMADWINSLGLEMPQTGDVVFVCNI